MYRFLKQLYTVSVVHNWQQSYNWTHTNSQKQCSSRYETRWKYRHHCLRVTYQLHGYVKNEDADCYTRAVTSRSTGSLVTGPGLYTGGGRWPREAKTSIPAHRGCAFHPEMSALLYVAAELRDVKVVVFTKVYFWITKRFATIRHWRTQRPWGGGGKFWCKGPKLPPFSTRYRLRPLYFKISDF